MNYTAKLMLFASVACIALATPAYADEEAQGSSSEASNSGNTLKEIVVTAERRTSTEQRTAASISTRAGDDLTNQGRYSLAAIIDNIPGVVGGAAESPGGSVTGATDNPAAGLTFRGIQSNVGTGGSVTSTAATAAIYVDGVYNGIGGSYDIERVEVLRGPQGTLYGRSATSGVIAIHTRDPDLNDFGVNLLGHVGNYNLTQISGAVNIPLIADTLALRVSGNRYARDGYYAPEGGYRRSSEGRVKLLYKPTENFSALLGYLFQDNVANVGGISIRQDVPNEFKFVATDFGKGKNNYNQFWGEFTLDLGGVTVTYLPAYKTWKQNTIGLARGNALEFNQYFQVPKDTFHTQELRLNSNSDSALSWQTGVFFYENDIHDINRLEFFPSGMTAFKSESFKNTRNIGAFGEATFAVSDTTRITGGIRYDHTRVRNNQNYTSILGLTKVLTGDEGLREFNNFTYKARIEHDLTPSNMLYASVSTGFSPGDVAVTTDVTGKPIVVQLDDQTLTAYEFGTKNRFLGNRLQVNAAVYYNDYGGFQTAGINLTPNNPLNPTFRTIVAPLRSYGAELEILARPWTDGQVGLNVAYTHSRYHDIAPQFQYLFWTDEVPGAVPVIASGWIEQGMELEETTRLSFRAEAIYRSSYYPSRLTAEEVGTTPPFGLNSKPYAFNSDKVIGNLSATLSFEDGRYSLTGYVRNVGDVRYKTDSRRTPPIGPGPIGSTVDLSDPRTFGITVSVRM